MVFDVFGNDRLVAWKEFRDSLETSEHPLQDVAELWSHAPFVEPYLDPLNPSKWPDPWHLILDLHLDDLAIVLGMLYTIKLTQRFMDTKCEIHMSVPRDKTKPSYMLVIDGKDVLNLEYRSVVDIRAMDSISTKLIWSKTKL